MPPQRRTNRANARAPGAFLLPELASRAADFALVLGLVRARTRFAAIPARSFVQKMRIDLHAEDRVRQLQRTDFLAFQIKNIHDRHNFSSFSTKLVLQTLQPNPRNPANQELLLDPRFADENVLPARPWHGTSHQQQVLVVVDLDDLQIPGRNSLVAHVPRKVLVLPHARRKGRPADAARRAVKHRTVRGVPAGIVPALDAARETLALADAAHVDQLAGREIFHQHAIANLSLVLGLFNAHF